MTDTAPAPFGSLLDEAREVQSAAVTMRRDLHLQPEIGNDLPRTQERILAELQGLPLQVRTGDQVSSVVAVLEGSKPGPTMLLRGDMDALPMPEDTGLPYASEVDGAMHACGHDTHVAMLAGAAKLLTARRDELAGRVLFMFQPGEEGYHGAKYMLDEGLLDGVGDVTGAFALHISTMAPAGTVNLRGGTMMASADTMRIRVIGRGGHASAPHHALDPIPIACEIVQALQLMITRQIDVFDPAVVTVGQITAGTTNNVIPEHADILGTIRAVSERTRAKVHDAIRRVSENIAAAHSAEARVEVELGYPVTVNDMGYAGQVLDTATQLLGTKHVNTMSNPVMGAEDFSYVLQRVPGALAFLGGCPPELNPRTAPPNHSNRVVFDEEAMVTGMATYAAMALRHLS